jgi:hypothetical protein
MAGDLNYQFVFHPDDPHRLHIPRNLIDLTLPTWQKLPACHRKNQGLRVEDLRKTKPYTLKQVPSRICPDCLAEADANGMDLKSYDRGIEYEEPIEESPLLGLTSHQLNCPECHAVLSFYVVGPSHS